MWCFFLVYLGGSWCLFSCSSLDEDEIEWYMCRFKISFSCKLNLRCGNVDDLSLDGDSGGGIGVGGGSLRKISVGLLNNFNEDLLIVIGKIVLLRKESNGKI